MTTVPPTNSKTDSKTGKSTDNFVGPQCRFNMIGRHKKYKEQVTKHFNSVFDTSTVGNL